MVCVPVHHHVPVQPSITYRYSKRTRTGTQPAEGNPRANQKSNFLDFGTPFQTTILGTRTMGRNTVYDPSESLRWLVTQIKHSNLAICKGPVRHISPLSACGTHWEGRHVYMLSPHQHFSGIASGEG
uniref:Uncharacterized protein n=1 Tax=Ananas comosus var. bracteatus TaxID=296719 RepID=A0A6V7QBM3_ANACO|nr:unnamed protein product [Ananas comosus var. bracteatus]